MRCLIILLLFFEVGYGITYLGTKIWYCMLSKVIQSCNYDIFEIKFKRGLLNSFCSYMCVRDLLFSCLFLHAFVFRDKNVNPDYTCSTFVFVFPKMTLSSSIQFLPLHHSPSVHLQGYLQYRDFPRSSLNNPPIYSTWLPYMKLWCLL